MQPRGHEAPGQRVPPAHGYPIEVNHGPWPAFVGRVQPRARHLREVALLLENLQDLVQLREDEDIRGRGEARSHGSQPGTRPARYRPAARWLCAVLLGSATAGASTDRSPFARGRQSSCRHCVCAAPPRPTQRAGACPTGLQRRAARPCAGQGSALLRLPQRMRWGVGRSILGQSVTHLNGVPNDTARVNHNVKHTCRGRGTLSQNGTQAHDRVDDGGSRAALARPCQPDNLP